MIKEIVAALREEPEDVIAGLTEEADERMAAYREGKVEAVLVFGDLLDSIGRRDRGDFRVSSKP